MRLSTTKEGQPELTLFLAFVVAGFDAALEQFSQWTQ
jgi:hypothetical protein